MVLGAGPWQTSWVSWLQPLAPEYLGVGTKKISNTWEHGEEFPKSALLHPSLQKESFPWGQAGAAGRTHQ